MSEDTCGWVMPQFTIYVYVEGGGGGGGGLILGEDRVETNLSYASGRSIGAIYALVRPTAHMATSPPKPLKF